MSRVRSVGGIGAALCGAVVVAVLVAGCGDDDGGSASASRDAVPAGAVLYAEAAVRPEGDLGEQVDALLERFGGLDPGAAAVEGLESAAAEEGVDFTYSADIEPWLGERISIFLLDFADSENAAVLVESTDDEAAQAAVDKLLESEGGGTEESFDGHDYVVDDDGAATAVDDGLVMVGAPEAVEAAFETIDGGSGLAEDEAFAAQLDGDELDGSLASLYVDVEAAIAAEGALGESERAVIENFAPELLQTPVTATVALGDDTATADFGYGSFGDLGSIFYPGGGSPLMGELPADAWVAAGAPAVGETYQATLDTLAGNEELLPPGSTAAIELFSGQLERRTGVTLEQALGAIGDVAFYLRGAETSALEGAVVIEVLDEQTAAALLNAARREASRQPGATVRPIEVAGASGFEATAPGQPKPLVAVIGGDRAVVGYGAEATEAALQPAEMLADSDTFAAAGSAVGDDTPISAYVELGPAIDVIGAAAADPAELSLVAPYLEPLSFLAAGSGDDGSVGRSRIVVGFD